MIGNKYVLAAIGVGILAMGLYNVYFFYQRRIPRLPARQVVAPSNQPAPTFQPKAPSAAVSSSPTVPGTLSPPPPLTVNQMETDTPSSRTFQRETWGRNPFLTPSEMAALEGPRPGDPARQPTGPATEGGQGAPAVSPPPMPLNITAIMVGGQRNVAIINEQLVREGDLIGGERVVQIQPDAVVLEKDGKRRVVQRGADPRPFEIIRR